MEEFYVEYFNAETATRAVTVADSFKQLDVHTFEVRHDFVNVDWIIDMAVGDEIVIQRAI